MQLTRHTAIYGLGSISAKVVALVMLPLYVHYLDPRAYGIAETVMVINLFTVALVKLGLQNSMMRFYYDHPEDPNHGVRVVRVVWTAMLVTTTAGSIALLALSRPIAAFLLHDPGMAHYVWIAIFGLWAMNLYQTLVATYRLEKRPAAFSTWALLNVVFTVAFTIGLVVFAREGAAGLLMGNFLGTAVLLPFIGWQQRRYIVPVFRRSELLRSMIRFGIPTMPMAIANTGLLLIDRSVITREVGLVALGQYSLASRMAQVVTLVVIALQLSWQPFAYSIRDDGEARRTYSMVMNYYVAATGWLIVTTALVADPAVRLLTRPAFYESSQLIPLLALSAGVYGMYFIAGVGASRVKRTGYHFAVAGAALGVSVIANLALVPRIGTMGAAASAVLANGALTLVMFLYSQRWFPVSYDWRRLAVAAASIGGFIALAYSLPHGAPWALPVRVAGIVAYPVTLWLAGFFPHNERRALARRLRRA